jgi:hypothetical protein
MPTSPNPIDGVLPNTPGLVLRPSGVPEKVGINQKGIDQK